MSKSKGKCSMPPKGKMPMMGMGAKKKGKDDLPFKAKVKKPDSMGRYY